MPVEGLSGDAEFGAEVADLGVGLAHGGGGQAELGGGHPEGTASLAGAGAGGGQASDGAVGDEFSFDYVDTGLLSSILGPTQPPPVISPSTTASVARIAA